MSLILCPFTVEYEPQFTMLAAALRAHGVDLTPAPYETCHDWEKNTRGRAAAALKQIEIHAGAQAEPSGVWIIDADMYVMESPREFFEALPDMPHDIAVSVRHDHAARDPDLKVAAGLVGINRAKGMAFLRDWARRCAEYSSSMNAPLPEQRCFVEAVRQAEASGALVAEIPPEYHAKPEDVKTLWNRPVLVNGCESRKMRKVVGARV